MARVVRAATVRQQPALPVMLLALQLVMALAVAVVAAAMPMVAMEQQALRI